MIFFNPAGAPELACDSCGCRWFDRMTNTCYECASPVTRTMVQEFEAALDEFSIRTSSSNQYSSPTGTSNG
jgi:hypothetical protein